jgi:hypothetical protein
MRNVTKLLWIITSLLIVLVSPLPGQVENVPINHPVYIFLKRMEVKGIIERYHDAILPISRREVGKFLKDIQQQSLRLSESETGYLTDFLSEFQFDIDGTTKGFSSLIDSPEPSSGAPPGGLLSNREKYLYLYSDSSLSFFVNGLLTFDARRIRGDALGSEHTEFIQFGGRIRGTMYDRLGYYLQGTNAQFWGSRELLERDRIISQTHALYTTDAQNFDMSEGYVRYDGGIVSAQLGTERVLWGNGYDQQMVLSDNVRPFPFVRADAQYKALKYTFLHGWLLGTRSGLVFTLPSDTSAKFLEPLTADKYFVGHRIEFSFPRLFDVGFQEMLIYSNRSPDLAYLNPLIVIESAQRARDERDNTFWVFDMQTHFLPGAEFTGTLLFDDLHFGEFFKPRWYNRYGYQLGAMFTDLPGVPNTNLMIEWTRIEPYVFAHDRSRDDNYSSGGSILGPRIGPNSDSWFVRADYLPARNLFLSLRVTLERHGANIVDASGHLLKNVGGDFLQPHRPDDPTDRIFLDGILMKTRRLQALATYEIVNQMWLEGWYEFESIKNETDGSLDENQTFGIRLRTEF